MCPRYRSPPPARTPSLPATRLTLWLASALCITVNFYRHRLNEAKICRECYLGKSSRAQSFYDAYSRHYILLGDREAYEECARCDVILFEERAISQCEVCPETLAQFVQHLNSTGETPYDDPEPTMLMISQTRL